MKNRCLLAVGLLILAAATQGRGPSARLHADDQESGAEKNGVAAAELDLDLVDMTNAAEQTYVAYEAAYKAGTATSTDLYVWSRRWLDSQCALAKNHAEQMAALRSHRRRMMNMFLKINALYIEGIKGGEAERFHAATLELVAPFAEAVPIGLSTSDAEALLENGGTSRVIYATGQSEIRSISGNWRTPTDDIVNQAEAEGTVLAIISVWRAR